MNRRPEPFAGGDATVDPADLAAASRFLHGCAGARVAVACDSDVDGLTAAVIVERQLRRLGGDPHVLPVRRGEHVHHDSMRRRIADTGPARLVVVDMGSRPAPIVEGLPTLVIDHHHADAGGPPGAVLLNPYRREPVPSSSVLAFMAAEQPAEAAWLAALGAIADLGSAAAFASMLGIATGGRRWTDAVSLLNGARRAPDPEPEIALALLRRAGTVAEITSGVHPETARLLELRREVAAETARCARTPPRVLREAALIRFSSRAQVHPLVAIRWVHRLAGRVVIAANDGYLPGRTNFAIRSAADIDLIAWLTSLPFVPAPGAEFANGHRRATGGSLSHEDFTRFVEVLS